VTAANHVTGLYERFLAQTTVLDLEKEASGDLVSRMARHPGLAARAVVRVGLANTMASVGMVLSLLIMAVFSWQAALLLALALPVMVVFFIFVGGLTARHAQAQEDALQHLSGSFADKIRCLPTIFASAAVDAQAHQLEADLKNHESRAAGLLRVAFLNSAVLDFFSSLSIAMLAIFLGLGHLGLTQMPGFYGIDLTSSLSILILAPEVFGNLRKFADLYHQSAEGKTALRALESIDRVANAHDGRIPTGWFGARKLTLHQRIDVSDFDLPVSGLVAIVGPSGSGKTSLLRTLAGVDAPASGQVFRGSEGLGWAAADAWLPAGTLAPFSQSDLAKLRLFDDPRLASSDFQLDPGGANVSGGQRQRLSLVRAAVCPGSSVFADEPTAKLDPIAAAATRKFLHDLSKRCLVVVATHDEDLWAHADQVLNLEPSPVALSEPAQ